VTKLEHCRWPKWVTLNNASDYRINGLYRTHKINPNTNPSPFIR